MTALIRIAGLTAILFLAESGGASAATPKEIEAAKKKGADWIKAKYSKGASGEIGPMCLSGLALLEYGTPGDDPAVKAITAFVRNAAYSQTQTYQISLCLMYLERYGEPADIPLVQALAVRLLVGQASNGGWTYMSIGGVSQADEQVLRALKPGVVGKLHPEVEKYGQALTAARAAPGGAAPLGDDNSNTQFAVIALWMSRKHGVPVDGALDLSEKRFLATQNPRTGCWPYASQLPGVIAQAQDGSPAMYCAGLIGLSTGIARREERLQKPEPKKKPDTGGDPKKDLDDPFTNPPAKPADPKKPAPARPLTITERSAQFAYQGLGMHVAESARAGNGSLNIKGEIHGHHDYYFLWSVERVGVIYGWEKIGGVDWYEAGAHSLVHAQTPEGCWNAHSYGTEVNTGFAMLFLCRSNLARDLAGKVQKEAVTELKAGNTAPDKKGNNPGTGKPDPLASVPFVPGPTGSEIGTLAAELLRASDQDWTKVLAKLRETKGAINTQALVVAITRLEADRRKEAREALAERLTRMNAETLRAMAKEPEPELRRGAILAMAMKDEKVHIPDLIAAITDEEDIVIRAARAGLRSLTGEDFGPAPNATAGEKQLAADSWKKWLEKQKK